MNAVKINRYILCESPQYMELLIKLMVNKKELDARVDDKPHWVDRAYILRSLRKCKLFIFEGWRRNRSVAEVKTIEEYLEHLDDSIELIRTNQREWES